MNDSAIKWGLIGLGAYLLYESFVTPAVAAPVGSTASNTATTGAGAATHAQPAPAPSTAQHVQKTMQQLNEETLHAIGPGPVIIAAQHGGDIANANESLTAPQWDWYLYQVSGINANDTATITGPLLSSYLPAGNTADMLMTAGIWWNAILQWAAAQSAASVAAPAPVGDVDGTVNGTGLGYRDATATTNFAAPPEPGAGRFPMVDEAWA